MSRLTANLSMTNELAEEYRELKRNLIPILLQTCGKERLCDAVDKWLLVKSGIKVISKSWYEGGLPGKEYVVIKDTSVLASYPSKGANYEHRLARYRAYTKAFNHVREEGVPLAPIQVDKFTKVLVNGVTLCLIGTFEDKSENDFIKEISGKVYVKAGTDSVDVINLQTRRTKRYKVQYT